MENLSLVSGGAIAVNRFVEALKPYIDKLGLADNTRKGVLILIAVLSGILIALLSNGAINLFAVIYAMPTLLGQILTGIIIGFGSDIVNAFITLLYGARDRVAPPASTTK